MTTSIQFSETIIVILEATTDIIIFREIIIVILDQNSNHLRATTTGCKIMGMVPWLLIYTGSNGIVVV